MSKFIPLRLKLAWAWRLPLAIIVILSTYFIVPIACLFTRLEVRTDTMKRKARELGVLEYTQFTTLRTYLHPAFNWYQTHDNAMDEYWYGGYDDAVNNRFTQDTYDNSWLLRYYNLVMWGWRNKAYNFRYLVLGVPQSFDEPSVFKDGDTTLYVWDNYFLYERINGDKKQKTGWNSHRSAPLLSNGRKNVMYAIK
jgi:hypothetical protein